MSVLSFREKMTRCWSAGPVAHSLRNFTLAAGVKIYQFEGGLLHTKSVLVDGELSLVGTVNLDMRSLWLNFETITSAIDDKGFGANLAAVQGRLYFAFSSARCPFMAKTSIMATCRRATVLLLQPVAVKRRQQRLNR